MAVQCLSSLTFLVFYLLVCGSSKTIQLMGMFSFDGSTVQIGEACMAAIRMAMRDVRERSDLLPGYDLNLTWRDTKCHGGLAVKLMYEMLYDPPPKIMVLGPTCSVEAQATADSSYMWNVTQVTFGALSPALSDRVAYPRFFRVPLGDDSHNPARVALIKYYKWRRVATIHFANEFFSLVIDDLIKLLQKDGVSLVSSEIFIDEPKTQLENLITKDARIIVVGGYDYHARIILCQAYHLGLYGGHVVWLFPGWYSGPWWRDPHEGLNCTAEQMKKVTSGNIINIGNYDYNPKTGKGANNLTYLDWDHLFSVYTNFTELKGHFARTYCYDSLWAVAVALDNARKAMVDLGMNKTLDEFTYADADMGNVVLQATMNVSFEGTSGYTSFRQNGEQFGYTKISQNIDEVLVDLGYYNYHSGADGGFCWREQGVIWPGGRVPNDSKVVVLKRINISISLYVTMTAISCVGILIAILFLAFNIFYRHRRIVKMSSPLINNILLVGCMLIYITVFLQSSDDVIAARFCKIRKFTFIIGFSVVFGALFSKTFRVYRIFTNKQAKQIVIRDSQLVAFILALTAIDLVVLTIWEVVDAHALTILNLTEKVSESDYNVIIQEQVAVCVSEYSVYFSMTLYVIQGLLMAFGAFLAWETRKVHIDGLNDSKYIGMCVYNVAILSCMGATLSFALDNQVVLLYGLTSGFQIAGTTLTQLIVFVPKVLSINSNNVDSMHSLAGTKP